VIGRASLIFARHGPRTVLIESRVAAPLALVRPFELPGGRLVVQMVTLGPGLCSGDLIDLEVIVQDDAEVLLTTTAATRIMSMDPGQQAEQRIRFRADRGSSLEYYPAPAIPFPGSAFVQTLSIEAHPTARVGVVESWALGRSARAEYLQFRSLSSQTRLAVAGTLAYADALALEPARHDLAGVGVLDGRHYLAAGFFLGVDSIPDGAPAPSTNRVDVALALTRPGLAYLRALADDAPSLDAAIQGSLERVARAWGQPLTALDRFHC
jgi:urease accessory protein